MAWAYWYGDNYIEMMPSGIWVYMGVQENTGKYVKCKQHALVIYELTAGTACPSPNDQAIPYCVECRYIGQAILCGCIIPHRHGVFSHYLNVTHHKQHIMARVHCDVISLLYNVSCFPRDLIVIAPGNRLWRHESIDRLPRINPWNAAKTPDFWNFEEILKCGK